MKAADLRGTGYPDLFFANDYGVSEMFVNRGGTRFEDVAAETGVGRAPKSGMNAAFGDIFNDGRLSIYKTNISEPGVLVQANDLWLPRRAADGPRQFDDLAAALGVDLGKRIVGRMGDIFENRITDVVIYEARD